MTAFIVAIHVIVCFVLILVILLQAGRGSGLSWGSFGGSPQSFLGTKSASFLAKATSACAIVFLLTCILLNVLEVRKSRSLYSSGASKVDLEKIKQALDQAKTGTQNVANGTTAVASDVQAVAANSATEAASTAAETTAPQANP